FHLQLVCHGRRRTNSTPTVRGSGTRQNCGQAGCASTRGADRNPPAARAHYHQTSIRCAARRARLAATTNPACDWSPPLWSAVRNCSEHLGRDRICQFGTDECGSCNSSHQSEHSTCSSERPGIEPLSI